jgi:DNA-binding NarL/FixJ family response regulator
MVARPGGRHSGGMNIFLVEDSGPVRERLAEMLSAIPGARLVGTAEQAEAAIRDILTARPEVVVLDISLRGGTSGFDVLRGVRDVAPDIDFYMLSNFAAEPYRQLAQRLGAREFFDKSKEFDRVRQLIATRAARTH